MGETADQTARELAQLRAKMSDEIGALRHESVETAKGATPLAIAAAGLGVLVVGVLVVVRHRHKAEAKRLVGTLKRLAETLESRPDVAIGALGSLPGDALREVIERKPSEPRMGAKLLEVAVKSAVTTAIGFGLRELKDRLVASGGAPSPSARSGASGAGNGKHGHGQGDKKGSKSSLGW
jgi:hypothetical protein